MSECAKALTADNKKFSHWKMNDLKGDANFFGGEVHC